MGESPPPVSLQQARAWMGSAAEEIGGGEIGPVRSLFADAESGEPTWLIVKQGRRRRGTLVAVPVRDCAAAAGCVWIAHEAATIRSAPVVDPNRPLLREHELTICAHFGIGERVGRAAEVVGRPQAAVTSTPAGA